MEGRSGDLLGGRYRLVELTGIGGMGRVWKAHDEQLNRAVAVKEVTMPVMPAAEREERLTRAQREGLTAAALADHPNIVTVYDVIIENGVPWTVMQFVKGRALSGVLYDGPLSVDAVAGIAEAMLAALEAAHEAGVVHRDIKPGNIMMADDGRILLTDFGIARVEGDQTVTVTGAFVGSLAYVAPERAEGKEGGRASDLFSLGVTLFEAVEGTSPFRRDSTAGTLTALLVKPLPPMQRAGRLAPLITALTEKDPDDRPNSAQALKMLRGEESGWQPPARTTEENTKTSTQPPPKPHQPPWQDPTAKFTSPGPSTIVPKGSAKSVAIPKQLDQLSWSGYFGQLFSALLMLGAVIVVGLHVQTFSWISVVGVACLFASVIWITLLLVRLLPGSAPQGRLVLSGEGLILERYWPPSARTKTIPLTWPDVQAVTERFRSSPDRGT